MAPAADLSDEIVIEIIKHLPTKNAARCRVLSKYFYRTISTPRFLLEHLALLSPPSSNSIILHHSHTNFTRISSPVRKSVTLPTEHRRGLRILDSCNGIFLLYFRDIKPQPYSVFNPFTGGFMSFKNYLINRLDCGSLVVDINPSDSSGFDFKLVELQAETTGYRGVCPAGILRFRVLVPEILDPKDCCCELKEGFRLDYEGSFNPLLHQDRGRPVYAHGCVHWLGVGATAIAVFDVESSRARIMDGPVTHAVDCTNFRIWFGLARGSLQFIRTNDTDDTIIVNTHNYITQEWRVAHKIQQMMIPLDMKRMMIPPVVVPVFFDGQNVLCHISKLGHVDIQEIYVHDLSTGVWRQSGQVVEVIETEGFGEGFGHRYVEFVPTTARVSDFYLSNINMPPEPTRREICLLQLHQLLLD